MAIINQLSQAVYVLPNCFQSSISQANIPSRKPAVYSVAAEK